MEKSQLENIGNTQLFFLLKILLDNSDDTLEGIIYDGDIMESDSFIESCDSAGNIIGISLDYPIDQNYIVSVLK